MATVFSALISAGVTLIVCLITTHAQSQKDMALIQYRLEQLEKKVDKHNNLIDRTYALEEKTALIEKDILTLKGECNE